MTARQERSWRERELPHRIAWAEDYINRLDLLPDRWRFEFLPQEGTLGKLQVVVGGQYGSEGKGAIAAFLCSQHRDGLAIRVAGPNAGHTVIGRCPPDCPDQKVIDPDSRTITDGHASDRHPWRLQHVPVAAVSNPGEMLMIAAGSEIEPELLETEVSQLDKAGYRVSARLFIDGSATVIESAHRVRERTTSASLVEQIGSTGKGVGAARADRAMRCAGLVRDHWTGSPPAAVVDTAPLIRDYQESERPVLVEGTQGYGLGTHAGHYPKCTSSDCRAIDMLAMAGISPWAGYGSLHLEVWVVFRTYPIRVAGNSGPLPLETTWEALGLPEEMTTVTRKVRRVGLWDPSQTREAILANGGPRYGERLVTSPGTVRAALTMTDHVVSGAAGFRSLDSLPDETQQLFTRLLSRTAYDLGVPVSLAGTGPDTVIDLRDMT